MRSSCSSVSGLGSLSAVRLAVLVTVSAPLIRLCGARGDDAKTPWCVA
jgi:hypothetical protein